MSERIILIGGGGHCRSCIDVIERSGRFIIAGIVDVPEKIHHTVLGYPVIGSDDNLADLVKTFPSVMITLGQIKSPDRRIKLYDDLTNMGACFPVVQSPLAYVSSHAKIAEGTIIMHHVIIDAGAIIGRNCIINNKALIEHDAVVDDHCHISTGAIVNGGVKIGRGTFLGSNAVVTEGVSIPPYSFVKANSLTTKAR